MSPNFIIGFCMCAVVVSAVLAFFSNPTPSQQVVAKPIPVNAEGALPSEQQLPHLASVPVAARLEGDDFQVVDWDSDASNWQVSFSNEKDASWAFEDSVTGIEEPYDAYS